MALRYPIAGALALLVTVLIFFQMQALITVRAGARSGLEGTKIIDFVRLKKEPELLLNKRELPKKEIHKKPPVPDLNLAFPRKSKPESAPLQVVVPAADLSLQITGGPSLGSIRSDTDTVPLVRVNPQYPYQAIQRGIEGWVEVTFTISATGSVKNAVVVDSHPGTVFNQAALRAIRKWKYKPKVKDGVAVERPGVRVRLDFELED